MPSLEQLPRRSRLARFNEIINILVENDFWGLLQALLKGQDTVRPSDEPAARKLRVIFERLGPTFVKLGQLLATRPDLVPRAYAEEFKQLYDGTKPSPFENIRDVVREELGKELEEVFQSFEPTAIASASVGQVHKAVLLDGTPVAVKVQHPGIETRMILDFQILRGLVTFIEKTFAASRIWQPTQHLEELQLMLERELDYGYEMKNTLRVANNFRNDDAVRIPRMFQDHSSKRILVMEFMSGHKFANVEDLDTQGIDRKSVAKIITHAMAKQIFVHRVFHADPSPGNMMVMNSHQVAFLDFGAVGVVTERRAKNILRLITAISKGDTETCGESVIDLCDQYGEHDPKRFQVDTEKLMDFFEREEVSVADPRLMEMIMGLAKKHKMLLPPDFMLITRALFQFDGFCRDLDPDYDLVTVLEPLVAELVWKNLTNTRKQKEIVEETLGELLKFGRQFPHTLNQLVRRVERNELRTTIDIAGLEGIKASQGRTGLKMSFTIVVAALIVGLGIVYTGPDPDARVLQFLFGASGLVVLWAFVLLMWSEMMKGNRE